MVEDVSKSLLNCCEVSNDVKKCNVFVDVNDSNGSRGTLDSPSLQSAFLWHSEVSQWAVTLSKFVFNVIGEKTRQKN